MSIAFQAAAGRGGAPAPRALDAVEGRVSGVGADLAPIDAALAGPEDGGFLQSAGPIERMQALAAAAANHEVVR
jgi:hypothetical protein